MNANNMKVGDFVEFASDRQTEKGPSSGKVVERGGSLVAIAHSDHKVETFKVADLTVSRLTQHHRGGPIWVLA